MVSNISGSGQTSDISMMPDSMKTKRLEEVFKQMSLDAGSDGTTISKDQLQTLIDKAKKDGKDTKSLEDIMKNFDKVATSKDANGTAVITSSDLEAAMQNGTLKAPARHGHHGAEKSSSATDSSSSSSTTSSTKLTKDQLQGYYNELQKLGEGNSDIAKEIKDAISNYGSSSTSSLTKETIQQAIDDLEFGNSTSNTNKEPQDPSTITTDQVTPPIDIRV